MKWPPKQARKGMKGDNISKSKVQNPRKLQISSDTEHTRTGQGPALVGVDAAPRLGPSRSPVANAWRRGGRSAIHQQFRDAPPPMGFNQYFDKRPIVAHYVTHEDSINSGCAE
jgi:hypothetical protein